MKHIVVCFVFVLMYFWCGFANAQEFSPTNARRGEIIIVSSAEYILVNYVENGSLRASYRRYLINRRTNLDELIVFNRNNGRQEIVIRVDQNREPVHVSMGETNYICGNTRNYDICEHAAVIFRRWYVGINFERYIRDEINRRFLP